MAAGKSKASASTAKTSSQAKQKSTTKRPRAAKSKGAPAATPAVAAAAAATPAAISPKAAPPGVAPVLRATPPSDISPRVNGRVLDARPDRVDFRDLPYRPPLRSLALAWPSDDDIAQNLGGYIEAGLVRDQGTEGACTGFGLACVANYLLFVRHRASRATTPFVSVSPRMFYELARRYDEWPGVDYEGSSCRGALKGWNKHGVCLETLWRYPLDDDGKPLFVQPEPKWDHDAVTRPLGVYYRVDKDSVVDLQAALNDIGAVYVSANVHDGWDTLMRDRKGKVPASHADLLASNVVGECKDPKSAGGHAFALVGYNATGFIVQNSWGERWGARGFSVLRYEDWVENGTDAWVCALGVPVEVSERRIALSRFRVPKGHGLGRQTRTPRNPNNPPDDPWPIDHLYETPNYQPWSTAAAYGHTLVSGNDGALIASDITMGAGVDPSPHADAIVVDAPRAWFANKPADAVAKLMIYAHGGLNDEDESIRRIRVLAPYAEANDVYPLFMTWKTGPVETLVDIFADHFSRRPEIGPSGGIGDALREGADRFVESTSHLLFRGIWTEMRENAQVSATGGRTLDLLATRLVALRNALRGDGRALEIHLVGHSAGSILLGHLLERMLRTDVMRPDPARPTVVDPPKIATCSLLAAACSVQFAIGTYGRAAQDSLFDLKNLWLHYLTDEQERDDGLPSPGLELYGKSLLYLVSRALDDTRKMPLLGMEKAIERTAFDPTDWASEQIPAIATWREMWSPAGPGALKRGVPVPTADVVVTKTGMTIQSTHGSFDNNVDAMTQVLERIRGKKLVAPIEWLDY